MRPATVNLKPHTRGDTWEGIPISSVTINGVPPIAPIVSARLQFRYADTLELAYELNSVPAVDKGTITIIDPNTWNISIDAQILNMPAGDYVWDFETTDSDAVVRTLYTGKFQHVQDITL